MTQRAASSTCGEPIPAWARLGLTGHSLASNLDACVLWVFVITFASYSSRIWYMSMVLQFEPSEEVLLRAASLVRARRTPQKHLR